MVVEFELFEELFEELLEELLEELFEEFNKHWSIWIEYPYEQIRHFKNSSQRTQFSF